MSFLSTYQSKETLQCVQYSKDKLPFIRPWVEKLGLQVEAEDETMIMLGNKFNHLKLVCEQGSYICVNEEGVMIKTPENLNSKYRKI